MKAPSLLRGLLRWLCLAGLWGSRCPAADEASYVLVDIEFKVLVPTAVGYAAYLPTNQVTANTDADLLIDQLNQQLDHGWRGLRYARFGDVKFVLAADVGDSDDPDNLNDLNDLFPRAGETNAERNARSPAVTCFGLAPARPTEWQYRNDVCNFYLLNNIGGGLGALNQYDPTATNMLVQSGFTVDPGGHELGHWFTLPHTFLSVQDNPAPVGSLIPWGDDGFTDTLLDWHLGAYTLNDLANLAYSKNFAALSAAEKSSVNDQFRLHYAKQFYNTTYPSLTASQKAVIDAYRTRDETQNDSFNRSAPLIRDLIANGNFGSAGSPVFYNDLSAANQARVDALINNIEAYHFGKGSVDGSFSEQQFDRLCDVISQSTEGLDRSAIRSWSSGKYRFFGGATTAASNPLGSSKRPYATPSAAYAAAGNRDVLIGRPGSYSVGSTPVTWSKPVTFRATRDGSFTLH